MNRPNRLLWVSFFVLAVGACDWWSNEPPSSESTAPPAQRSLEVAVERASDMSAQRALAEGAVEATGADTTATARGLEEIGASIEDTLEAAGFRPCQHAYEASVEARLREGERAPSESARDAYLAACGSLPEDARRCLVPEYRSRNAEACDAVLGRDDVRGGADSLHAMLVEPR
ncbi:MAG: hypothetical protein MUE69_32010 [Myxococcota bacterium]|jgi:hypothetical protein|nr:hypothetical protein [Myxococcota bacterium]